MSDLREQIKGRVDQLQEDALRLLQEMIRINSENPPGNTLELADFLGGRLKEWGMLVDILHPPEAFLQTLGHPGPRPSVLARLKGSGFPTLILNAHLDTVPVGDRSLWQEDPFSGKIVDGRICGRGAMDSKGRIAAYVTAMRAIKELVPDFRGNIILAATADEEIGGEAGTGYLIKEGILKGDYCIAEGMSDYLYHAYNGTVQWEVTTRGKACHAMAPEEGVNAIYKMVPLIAAIEKYHQRLSRRSCSVKGIQHPTCALGTIHGGTKTNVIPDRCVVTLDRRVTPDEKLDNVRKELHQLLEKTFPRTYEVREMVTADAYKTDPKSNLVKLVNENVKEVTGKKLVVKGMRGATDARFFANILGIPTVNFGPGRHGEGHGHAPNEKLRISDLVMAAKVCALTALDLANVR